MTETRSRSDSTTQTGNTALHVVVGLEGVQLQANLSRGIGRWTFGMIRALAASSDPGFRVSISATADSAVADWVRTIDGEVGWLDSGVAPEMRPGETTIFHLGSAMEDRPIYTLWPRWAREPEVRLITTLYDMIPMRQPDEYFGGRLRIPMMARYEAHRHADGVFAISAHARADGVRMLGLDPERVRVVAAGLDDQFVPGPVAQELLARVGVRPGSIFSVGNVDSRKNLSTLIEAFAQVPSDVRADRQLVITLSQLDESRRSDLTERARAAGVGDSFHVLGRVDDATLTALYRSCDVCVFVSLSEGLGLPVIEAMGCGTAILASDIEPMASIVPAMHRADPRSVASIAERLTWLLDNDEQRLLSARAGPSKVEGFRWSHRRESLLWLYRTLGSRDS